MARKKKGLDRGFSLVELLVAIAVIGVMLAIGVPAIIRQMGHLRLTRTTRDISIAMQAARLKAIARNVKFKVYIVQGAPDTYRLMFCNPVAGACANATLGAGDGWTNDTTEYGGGKQLPIGIDITSPAASSQTIFFPGGTATNEGSTTADQKICIKNTSNQTAGLAEILRVDIRAASGKVSISTGC